MTLVVTVQHSMYSGFMKDSEQMRVYKSIGCSDAPMLTSCRRAEPKYMRAKGRECLTHLSSQIFHLLLQLCYCSIIVAAASTANGLFGVTYNDPTGIFFHWYKSVSLAPTPPHTAVFPESILPTLSAVTLSLAS